MFGKSRLPSFGVDLFVIGVHKGLLVVTLLVFKISFGNKFCIAVVEDMVIEFSDMKLTEIVILAKKHVLMTSVGEMIITWMNIREIEVGEVSIFEFEDGMLDFSDLRQNEFLEFSVVENID